MALDMALSCVFFTTVPSLDDTDDIWNPILSQGPGMVDHLLRYSLFVATTRQNSDQVQPYLHS
jgi:hypothetical protein